MVLIMADISAIGPKGLIAPNNQKRLKVTISHKDHKFAFIVLFITISYTENQYTINCLDYKAVRNVL